jgi:hypothetical protein
MVAREATGKHMERRRGESEIGSDLVDRPSPDKPRLDRLSASAVRHRAVMSGRINHLTRPEGLERPSRSAGRPNRQV